MNGMHLAELSIGRPLAPTDDPRVAELMRGLNRVNGLGRRMSGFDRIKQATAWKTHACARIAAE